MSFYLRKSIKVGPVRFNLSKSGIGVSGGVKGFRAGTGPRGNYIHMGRGGVYYRKTLSSGGRHTSPVPPSLQNDSPSPLPSGGIMPTPLPDVEMSEIESADVSNMAHSSSAELLQELNEKKKLVRIGPWVLVISGFIFVSALLASVHPFLLCVFGATCIVGVFYTFRLDAIRKTTVLLYEFDPTLEQAFANLHTSITQLAGCSGCWHISASGRVHDRKYHAGASELIKRKDTTIRSASPDFLKTNIQTVAIGVGRQVLYFFPDRLLVFDAGRVGAVGYDELQISVSQTRFIEDSAPRDARVVDHTWKYVNKKGGPDRRFANNPQLPICLYDELHFSCLSGLNEVIQVSRCGIGQAVEQSIRYLAQYTKKIQHSPHHTASPSVSMTLTAPCPHCNTSIDITELTPGKYTCPSCKGHIEIE